MKIPTSARLRRSSYGVMVALGCITSLSAFAQEKSLNIVEDEVEEVVERIVTTGSRLKRPEFTSASPIQVIDGGVSREMGLFDATEMLQSSTQASGLQIDNTFGGFVLDNGPGSSTIGFRGLGAGRTLVLINGRRVAPAGVGGAPVSPDVNLIPSVMIDRIENLFDGASTVYGSDAIAGVANVILRKDVDGLDFQGSVKAPQSGGGQETTLSAMYGKSGNNYSFNLAAEYYDRKSQSYAQNDFASNCDELYYEGDDGGIYQEYRGIGPNANPPDSCDIFPLSNRVSHENFFGSLYYTPGKSNIGVPGWSESTTSLDNIPFITGTVAADSNGDGIDDIAIYDGNGDGLLDFNFQDPFYSLGRTDYVNSADWVSPLKRFSLFANGDYLFEDKNNTRFFYEALYANRASDVFSPGGQLFEWVGIDNPYNPCGTDPVNSVNCYAATGLDAFFGDEPSRMQPIVSIRDDRDTRIVDVYQYRLVAGVEGNISAFDSLGEGAWTYELSVNYSASKGKNSLNGINKAKLVYSLDNSVRNDDGSITCGADCVPVNLFAPNIYQLGGGYFSPEETEYLMTKREIETQVKQTVLSGFVTGDVYKLPWNNEIVPLVVGVEFRKDEIITDANDVAAKGLLWGYSSDKGADGSRNIREVYFETEFPLLKGKKYAEELTVTAAGRWTDESYYDPETIYSLKAVYRPNEWLTLRGTRGTSYRAPNLRERFLSGTSGFNTLSDPCVVPDAARDADVTVGGAETYNADNDTRAARILTSCSANGVDPTSLGLRTEDSLGFTANTSTEVTTGGTEALQPETSVSETYGFIIEQPFSEEFDLTLSVTKYNIEITSSIVEPTSNYIVDQCFDNINVPDGSSGFCGNIERNSTTGRLSAINASFINIGLEGSEGIDYNIFYEQDFVFGNRELGVTLDLQATQLQSAEENILGVYDDNYGEVAYPEWRASGRLSLEYADFRFNWVTRFIGKGETDEPDDFDTNTPCDGLSVLCRPVYYTDNYTTHSVSVNYSGDNYAVTIGVQNVFNDAPPKVDGDGVFSTRNIPLGVGYDLYGRSAYLSVGYTF
ncbi:TonB-dependent receptor [Paraglaciecola sp.]|uniref:TonB-dependent receptor domain-containing protein n=1 Tax=Paraglaciecola sp. TaxID=1920173 RepID=UPI0030F49960